MIRIRPKIAALLAGWLTAACGPQSGNPPPAANDTVSRAAPAPDTNAIPVDRGIVLFLGTSLTAGYGVGADVAFPARIQQKIDSAGLPFRVVNAGISGETSAGGLARLDWMLEQPIDVLVLELGANDGLRGYDIAAMRSNLETILRRTRAQYPEAALVVAGMEAPPNLGPRYTTRFRETFRDVARTHDATLIPFLLDGVAADPSLNLDDGMHPNERGHEIIAGNVWDMLEPVLARRAAAAAVPAGGER
jgi:acyl-CoA thioesterase-1